MNGPDWIADRIRCYENRNRFLALLGSFPNHGDPSNGEVERMAYLQTSLYSLGLMAQEYMRSDGRRYLFAERIPMVHPSHRADVSRLVFGDLKKGESDDFVSPLKPFERAFQEYEYSVRNWEQPPRTDEQWVRQHYEEASEPYRIHAGMKPGECCKALALIQPLPVVNAALALLPAVNLDFPKSVVNAKRDELFAANAKCSHCGLPIDESHHAFAVFVNSRQRWELVHFVGRRCDVDLIISENARAVA